jgi:glutathione S-transferase
MLHVYGSPYSTCTRKVLTTLHELEMPFEFDVVDMSKGEHKQPANLARQPFGKVPALDHDGFQMYESRAMCRYLNEVGGGALAPADAHGRARMEQWISIEFSYFSAHAMKFVYRDVMKRPVDDAAIEAAAAGLRAALPLMESRLTEVPFLAGSAFSLADITFMPYFAYAMTTEAKPIFAEFPKVSDWWARVSARPSWQKVTA